MWATGRYVVALWLALWATLAQAVYVDDFSPQGMVKQPVSQFVVRFSEPMVKLGDSGAAAPFVVTCPVAGQGRWVEPKVWRYDLPRPLAAGERCDFVLRHEVQALNGQHFYRGSDAIRYSVYTNGPWISHLRPGADSKIEEDQVFVLDVDQVVNPQMVEQHAWCEAEGVGERIPLKVLPRKDLALLVKALELTLPQEGISLVVQCARPLPPGAKVKLIWGSGLASVSGNVLRDSSVFNFQVRKPFTARMGCERERPNLPCSPLSNLWLEFSDQVSWAQASRVRLIGRTGEQKPEDWSAEYRAQQIREGKNPPSKSEQSGDASVERITFNGPFPANAEFTLQVPADLRDLSGRPLSNAAQFPLRTRVNRYPPLAKFAADFGILELKEGGLLPITVRHIEGNIRMRVLRQQEDAEFLQTWRALDKFEAQSPPEVQGAADGQDEDEAARAERYNAFYPREVSYLAPQNIPVQTLPKPNGSGPFEVMAIPLPQPGFYVVEVESRLLGDSLLSHPAPMYVRTRVLVTDMAVHFKKGHDNSLVWVTTLSSGKPVANAEVKIYGCKHELLGQGRTDAEGRWLLNGEIKQNPRDRCDAWFVTAHAGEDFSFVRSDWDQGIEPWRFNLPTWSEMEGTKIHTLLDRSLFRAGETVSMKHIARVPVSQGFAYPKPKTLPQEIVISNLGQDTRVTLPLTWDARGVATTQWKIPPGAVLGGYQVQIGEWNTTAEFRVSEFRLPKFQGAVDMAHPSHADKVPTRLSLAYLNGGSASGQKVQVSATLSPSSVNFKAYREYNFDLGYDPNGPSEALVLDKLALTLDAQGGQRLDIALPKKVEQPMSLRTEMTFSDPSGEIQTIAGQVELWPAEVAVGIRLARDDDAVRRVQMVALGQDGKPRAGVPLQLNGQRRWDLVHRKRILGGFYSYETETRQQELGVLCRGVTDEQGRYACELTPKDAGEIVLTVRAEDGKGGSSLASAVLYDTQHGDFWFEQADQDRMEVVPERQEYQPGDMARLRVHTPFHEATALISVEREGIVESFVRTLRRSDPVVEIPVGANWGPNVFVSVLAVRGRISEVPWYSFFQWGWRSPLSWLDAWRSSRNPAPATAMVDLARPAYKLGIARLNVGLKGARLGVEVSPDKRVYAPRSQVSAKIRVRLPNGKPAPAGAEVMVAVVDRALLELARNDSWDLLEDMMQERGYLVETSTAQMQVVGKRHFGKKALPAGGGGGRISSRELFDTLLYWNPRVKLDEQGMATVQFPLNDSLTAFRIVAVADVSTGWFGTGSTDIRATQDVQLIAALPPLVREGDHYQAMLSVRNTLSKPLKLRVQGKVAGVVLPELPLTLAADEARDLTWPVEVPGGQASLPWQIQVVDEQGKVWDSLKLSQVVQPRVPVTVQQSLFTRLEQPQRWPVVLPEGALPGLGGLEVRLSGQLAGQTDGIQQYFASYPYTCLEQKVSVASGLHDAKRWEDIVQTLSGYLDAPRGLLRYFPEGGGGSDALTSYVLSMAQAQGIALPDDVLRSLRKGLLGFVEKRSDPGDWPFGGRHYLPERRLHALAAMARYGWVSGRMLTAFEFAPIKQPTATLIDWYVVLRQVSDAPQRSERLAQLERELRNRMRYVGGRLLLGNEGQDDWWWMMLNGDSNALRFLAEAMDDPAWQADLPALLRGALLRQQRGRWSTTVANAWGDVALRKFSQRFEHEAVTGITSASLGERAPEQFHWDAASAVPLNLPWKVGKGELSLSHQGTGKPWATVLLSAAVPGKAQENGYRVRRSVRALAQKVPGQWSRGDLLRVRLDVEAGQSMSWVALSDPLPGGASILGNTERDSQIAQAGENVSDKSGDLNHAWPVSTERGLGYFRAYYAVLPKGRSWFEYTLRLNNSGEFFLPPTRIEAMYAPEIFGQTPNAALVVK